MKRNKRRLKKSKKLLMSLKESIRLFQSGWENKKILLKMIMLTSTSKSLMTGRNILLLNFSLLKVNLSSSLSSLFQRELLWIFSNKRRKSQTLNFMLKEFSSWMTVMN
jgi:hypothetical protein